MDIDPAKTYAVITGDFIGFSDLDAATRSRMPELLHRCGEDLREAFFGVMHRDIAVFRGDSWQALLDDPVRSLRAALFIRAAIRSASAGTGLDTRMAIGIGPIDYAPSGNISAGDGAAYRRSGKRIEQMGVANRGRLRLACPDIPDEALIDAIVRLAGTISDSWSSRQARAVLGALQGRSQAQIVSNWPEPITRQAVGKHLARAGWPAIAHALTVFESHLARKFLHVPEEG